VSLDKLDVAGAVIIEVDTPDYNVGE